jgi:hypothetical protein
MLGLETQPMPRLQKWTQFITRANIACPRVLLWTRVIRTCMRTQDPISRRRPSSGFPLHPLLGNMKKERHETSPSSPPKRQRNVPRRHRGLLDDSQACVKRRNNHTHARFVVKDMRKSKALGDTSELNTVPAHVCLAISNGVAPNNIGIISRSGMGWKLPS